MRGVSLWMKSCLATLFFDLLLKVVNFHIALPKKPPPDFGDTHPIKRFLLGFKARLLQPFRIQTGYPTWIRTMTKGSKGLCATVTPSGIGQTKTQQYTDPSDESQKSLGRFFVSTQSPNA